MLGRQQIAGIPTAIHELFKNAHDAYAENVRVDYIHSLDLFLLRDDGLGMTRSDFEQKWLTLGTESKVGLNTAKSGVWTGPKKLRRRATLGEKGIGRLAIAAIGPQVLVITKGVREDGAHPTVAGFVNWSLFEQPGIDLDQIEIPILELGDRPLPSVTEIEQLIQACRANLESLKGAIPGAQFDRITTELGSFDVDLEQVLAAIDGPKLDVDGSGTQFFIRPTSAELTLDLMMNSLTSDQGSTPLEKYLLGFSNTMNPARLKPPLTAEFWEHEEDGSKKDLIGPYSFFTPEEFGSADHHVEGHVDEHGVFQGTVRIYDQVEHSYQVSPPDDVRGRTDCGPFFVNFAYIQGAPKDTRMSLDAWKRLTEKCDRIGGLYIYRDGIRILPYGNSDYDWLNIERRRTFAAKDWFFSYRRLFGAVELTSLKNSALVEKAGREGFRQNRAYRQLSSILQELFKRLAFDFFRENAKLSGDYQELRTAKQQEYELLQRRAKQVSSARKEFDGALQRFFTELRAGAFDQKIKTVRETFGERLSAVAAMQDPVAAGEHLVRIESALDDAIRGLEAAVSISKPRSFGLSKRQKQDWEAYSRERKRIAEDSIQPLAEELSNLIAGLIKTGSATVDPRKRLEEPVQHQVHRALTAVGEARREAIVTSTKFQEDIRATMSNAWSELHRRVEEVRSELARTEVTTLDPAEIEARRDRLIAQVRDTEDRALRLFSALTSQLTGAVSGIEEGTGLVDVAAALESENDELKERVDQYADLAQVGLALGLVQHEFAGQVRNINRGLEALKPWADRNAGLEELYSRLRVSFEHLESYLQLFVPLNRRLHRERIPIAGSEIEDFLRTIFDLRLERHKIELVVTPEFRSSVVETYPSTILPVFTNIVDNAIFWLDQSKKLPKVIRLDRRPNGLVVQNNGPGVEEQDADRIFDFGESNRPGGRGMGLYLSRDALRKESMDIRLERAGFREEPSFLIEIPDELIA